MKLASIVENEAKFATFYKGMTDKNYKKFLQHNIPGFLSDLHLALVYADPISMGRPNTPVVMISVDVDVNSIEDKRDICGDMCGNWQYKTHPQHSKLRSSIWWADSGGHGMRGIYVGVPHNHDILFQADNGDEFREKMMSSDIQTILDKTREPDAIDNDDNKSGFRLQDGSRRITWKNFID